MRAFFVAVAESGAVCFPSATFPRSTGDSRNVAVGRTVDARLLNRSARPAGVMSATNQSGHHNRTFGPMAQISRSLVLGSTKWLERAVPIQSLIEQVHKFDQAHTKRLCPTLQFHHVQATDPTLALADKGLVLPDPRCQLLLTHPNTVASRPQFLYEERVVGGMEGFRHRQPVQVTELPSELVLCENRLSA
jgi:hypothetical protein